jgi:hypothetical protein
MIEETIASAALAMIMDWDTRREDAALDTPSLETQVHNPNVECLDSEIDAPPLRIRRDRNPKRTNALKA